ncbi:MAG: SIS domain-containing protein, partial [Clostridia bacterium]|nr:SIS domain-containing protein [Clostridia bacterium]
VSETVTELADLLAKKEDMFFIGRLLDSAAAMEGSLKMKEISYINSQAYAAGELKHGTISLVEEGTPVIALATQEDVFTKTAANLCEVKARGAYTILITEEKYLSREFQADRVIAVPDTADPFAVSLAVVPMQLLSYYTAKNRGCDIDKPKNLAKSVTVE